MLEILLGIIIFTAFVIALVFVIIGAKSKLVAEGDVEILINNEKKILQDELDAIEAARDYWEELRVLRNQRLSDCDWTQMSDVPFTEEQKISWKNYRQLLRDLPESITDPKQLVVNPTDSNWPIKPTY